MRPNASSAILCGEASNLQFPGFSLALGSTVSWGFPPSPLKKPHHMSPLRPSVCPASLSSFLACGWELGIFHDATYLAEHLPYRGNKTRWPGLRLDRVGGGGGGVISSWLRT